MVNLVVLSASQNRFSEIQYLIAAKVYKVASPPLSGNRIKPLGKKRSGREGRKGGGKGRRRGKGKRRGKKGKCRGKRMKG